MFADAWRWAAIARGSSGETWDWRMHLHPAQFGIGYLFENAAPNCVWVIHKIVNVIHRCRRDLGVCKGFEGLIAGLGGHPAAHRGIDLVTVPDARGIVLE